VVEKKRRILNHGQHEHHERERKEDERMRGCEDEKMRG
jgi:hypothetical protein